MFEQSRRSLIRNGIGLTSLVVSAPGLAEVSEQADEIVPLWPGTPPGGADIRLTQVIRDNPGTLANRNRRISKIATPMLVIKRAKNPNGAAIIAIPGGGYSVVNYDASGASHADWLNPLGVTTAVLVYRLPDEGWAGRADIPLQDAQRAIRLLRANAARWRINPDRIAVIGSSAGGHVAGSLATRFAAKVYEPLDDHDKLSARPFLAGLMFPVVTMGESAHVPSREALLGPAPTAEMRDAYSLEKHVGPDTPPLFICCAGDDHVVSPLNSMAMYRAMLSAQLKAELHIFQKGGHGFGPRLPAAEPASGWPDLFEKFARFNGLFA